MTNIGNMRCSIGQLVRSGNIRLAGDMNEKLFSRIEELEFSAREFQEMKSLITTVGVTDEFKRVIETFHTEKGTPAGFRREFLFGGADRSIRVDLKRDIAFQENGVRRPGNVLYSANAANPAELEPIKEFIAHITTGPQMLYSSLLSNHAAAKGRNYKDKYELLGEIRKVVGPGVDISVELNNVFADESDILEEIAEIEKVIPRYQLVINVPHTGPLNSENVNSFLGGQRPAYDKGRSKDFFLGHNLAYSLQKAGYRVNFTLMAEPHQTALALLAKPYFINTFIERRNNQTKGLKEILEKLDETRDYIYKEEIHDFMMKSDMLASSDEDIEGAVEKARQIVEYRLGDEKFDGLDSVRQGLRVLKDANLPETRLMISNVKSSKVYTAIDKLAIEPEFTEMKQKIVIACEPECFAQFTASPIILCYQRASLNRARMYRSGTEIFDNTKN